MKRSQYGESTGFSAVTELKDKAEREFIAEKNEGAEKVKGGKS